MNKKSIFISLLFLILIVFTTLLYLSKINDSVGLAGMRMVWGLIILWVCIGGSVMYHFREHVRALVIAWKLPWQIKFVIFATILALFEEAVTVAMTNLGTFFGDTTGKAFITASTNYFDVILFHSVIVFIPFFITTASLLRRFQFSAFSIFIFFGIVGTLAEALYAGSVAHIALFYQWIFVYGLMVYLPAYSIPRDRGAVIPRWYHYILAVPYIFLLALPMIALVVFVVSGIFHHPSIHF